MKILSTEINGVNVVETTPYCDERGEFYRAFCDKELEAVIGARRIEQVNFSRTSLVGTVRGMHFQHPPHAELKLVRCLRGRVWDVAVDLRAGSATYLQWFAVELTPVNRLMMVIPEGCAHGFQVLESDSELLYLHTARYTPVAEGGIRHDDPTLNIKWPLSVTEVSTRDRSHQNIQSTFSGLLI